MDRRERIHDFAVKYTSLLKNDLVTVQQVRKDMLRECGELGFTMDGGRALIDFCGGEARSLIEWGEFGPVAGEVQDIEILGNAVMARLSFEESQISSGEHPLSGEGDRKWYLTALFRMKELTMDLAYGAFRGKLKKIRIVSRWNALDAAAGDTTAQHLTMTIDGDVWMTSFESDGRGGWSLKKRMRRRIAPEIWQKISRAFLDLFGREGAAANGGNWEVQLTNGSGRRFCYTGRQESCQEAKLQRMTELLREWLEWPELWGFEDQEQKDRILRIQIERQKMIDEEAQSGRRESIELDRQKGTLAYSRVMENGDGAWMVYTLKRELPVFIDSLTEAASWTDHDKIIVFCGPGIPEMGDVRYLVKIFHSRKPPVILSLKTREREELPYWNHFLGKIRRFCADHSGGALADWGGDDAAGRYIYCAVEFSSGGKLYHYRTDDDSIHVGDEVVVPVGRNGEKKIVRVAEKLYCTEDNAPFPPKNTKRIIGKVL